MQVKRRADKSKHAQEEQWNIVGVLGRLGRCNVDIAGVWLTTTPPVANSTPRVNTALRISTRMLAMAVGQHVWNWLRQTWLRLLLEVCYWRRDPRARSRDRARLTRARTLRTWSWSQKGRWRDAPWVSPCVPGHTTQQVCLPWTGSPPVCVAGAQQWFGARLSHSAAVSH